MLINNVYIACVGYALEQCYSSGIEILGPIETDDEHLKMLQTLAKEYLMAEEIADYNGCWSFSKDTLQRIIGAKKLSEAYGLYEIASSEVQL